MSRMPTGIYIPGHSILHKLDAKSKILCFFILIAAVVSASTIWQYLILLVFTWIMILLARLPIRIVLAPIRSLWGFFLVVFAMNALFFGSAKPIWSWWIFHWSYDGMAQGLNVILRVIILMVWGSILTATTSPVAVTSALERLLRPLCIFRVSVDEVAMILSVAISFIPTLITETDLIKKAQIARGARFESRRLSEKAQSVLPLVIPIFLSSFRRADELATAMEARGYRNARQRTKRKHNSLQIRDYLALVICLILTILPFIALAI